MEVLSHRGYWTELGEKNYIPAFMRSLECGFGLETDRIVVSHDVPIGGEVDFDQFIRLLAGMGWFVGEFSPTAFSAEICEVAVKNYKAADRGALAQTSGGDGDYPGSLWFCPRGR